MIIKEQNIEKDSQQAEIKKLKESSIKIKLDNALSEKRNVVLLVETEELIKQSKLHKQELREMELKIRNMATSHKNETKSMVNDKDERITALHKTITVLNRESAQMEDELENKLRKCENKIDKFKTRLSKSSPENNIKWRRIIKALKSDIHEKQEELQRLRSGPDITLPGIKPNEYDPTLSHAKSLVYLERERSPGYLERRDDDDYSFGGSDSDSSKEENKTMCNLPDTVLEVNTTYMKNKY